MAEFAGLIAPEQGSCSGWIPFVQPCSRSLQSKAVLSSLWRSSVPPSLKFQGMWDSGHQEWDLHAVLLQHRGASWEQLKKIKPTSLNHRNSSLSSNSVQLHLLIWEVWAGFCLQTHSPGFAQPKKPQHKVPTETERVAVTCKAWITETNAKFWLLLRRLRNQRLMRLSPLGFERSLPGQSN